MDNNMYIRIVNGDKIFQNNVILEKANITFNQGEITAISSPNGSGKTTTLNIICGFMNLDKGTLEYSSELKKENISVVYGGDKNLYMKNTVKENIHYMAMLKGIDKNTICSNIVKFSKLIPRYSEIENKVCEHLSHGQKRLVSILIALVCDSRVIILDEVTEGLDQEHINILRNILDEIKKEKIIIVCSHDYSFLENLVDKIYFLKEHKFILSDSTQNIVNEYNAVFKM